jgi:hypothetical protein
LEELFDEFHKFSRAEVLHFRKLGQRRKSTNENESSRPFKYNKGKEGTTSFNMPHKQVHNIDMDGCRPPENWEKNFRPPQPESESRTCDPRGYRSQTRGGYTNRGHGRGRTQDMPLYCMFHERDTDYRMRDCPIFLEAKKKMTQKHSQPSTPRTAKEVNHTSHWHHRRSLLPQIKPRTKISTLAQNTNPTTTDTPPSITSHITTHRTQAKSTHLNR